MVPPPRDSGSGDSRPPPDGPPQNPAPSTPPPTPPAASLQGSFKLFRFAETDVYIHWTWFIAAVVLIRDRPVAYSSMGWDVAEYVAGFVIVLLHEFGHVFACRQGGGTADRVLLWPLGGLAFVAPMPRPGPYFWAIAAGPLVNVILAPILIGLTVIVAPTAEQPAITDWYLFCWSLAWFNAVVFLFNLLPLFPLDGGQMLFAVLWRLFGRAIGLTVVCTLGLIGGVALAAVAVANEQLWMAIMMGFLCYGSIGGLQRAKALWPLDQAERRRDYSCPHCKLSPPVGEFWICLACQTRLDLFDPQSTRLCPSCSLFFNDIPCIECGRVNVGSAWANPVNDT